MSKYELIGFIVIEGVGLIAGIIGIMKVLMKPVINLTNTITKLDTSLKIFVKEKDEVNGKIDKHEERLDDHEKRIYYMEHNKE